MEAMAEMEVVAPQVEEVDLNVQLAAAELSWQNVIVGVLDDDEEIHYIVRRRLLLVDRETRVACDAGLGTTLQCSMMQATPRGYEIIPNARIDVRRVSKGAVVRTNMYNGPGCIYSPGTAAEQAGWVQIACDDKNYDYFTQGAVPMQAVLENIQGIQILRLTQPYNHLAIVPDRDPTFVRGYCGVQLKVCLLGEVRLACRMEPQPDGMYRFSSLPQHTVAIKILRHFNNNIPDNDGIPLGTRQLDRALYDREDPIREIELTGFIGRSPNPDYPPHFVGHPNVMNFRACLADRHNIYMVMDFINRGDLFEAVFENSLGENFFNEDNARECMRQILSGVRFMHDIGVAHLDISSENVFVHALPNGTYRYILADMGQAVLHDRVPNLDAHVEGIDRFMPQPPYRAGSAPGKKMYYVPETFLATHPMPFCGFKVDMWQLGVLHIVVFCRSIPFRFDRGAEALAQWLNVIRRGQLQYVSVRPPLGRVVQGMDPTAPVVYFGVGYPEVHAITTALLQYYPIHRQLIYDTHPYYQNNNNNNHHAGGAGNNNNGQ